MSVYRETPRFCIFGLCSMQFDLLVDYVAGDLESHKTALLKCIQGSNDSALVSWPGRDSAGTSDLFEIEAVSNRSEAEEAVVFWRAYFAALGERVIYAGHLCDW